jgi:hypothetical protein
MPIISLNSRPSTKEIRVAYRPVYFNVTATASNGDPAPPVVYCDIYFNGVFYKTIAKSQYSAITVSNSQWEFDIQDAAQEYLRKFIGLLNGTVVVNASTIALSAYVKLRSSGIDTNGFIQAEGTAPIQATSGTAAVAGTGTQSPTFFILNASIQQEETLIPSNNLSEFKYDGWDFGIYSLTKRPNPYMLCRGDSDYYPVFDQMNNGVISKLRLNYRLIGQSTWRQTTVNIAAASGNALYIPNGPANLASVFPLVSFNDIEEYYVQALTSANAIQLTTVHNLLSNPCDDMMRVHFVNYDGAIDAINFKKKNIDHDTKSDSYETPMKSGDDRSLHGINRFNIKANDTYSVISTDYNEQHMKWLQQLFDTPAAWMELRGVYFEGDVYNPIVVLDGKLNKVKYEDRFNYEVELTFKFSHDTITLRN